MNYTILKLIERRGTRYELCKVLALLLIKVRVALHRQRCKNGGRYEISLTFMTQFPQRYHVRRKSFADILTYLLVRRLLRLSDVH